MEERWMSACMDGWIGTWMESREGEKEGGRLRNRAGRNSSVNFFSLHTQLLWCDLDQAPFFLGP